MARSGNRFLSTLVLLLAAGPAFSRPLETPALQAPADPSAAARNRLSSLVTSAEKALAEKDPVKAAVRVEEAEAFVADWVLEDLKHPEVVPLLDRLRKIQALLHEAGEPEPEPGLKVDEEVVALSGEDLRAEMAQVQQAEVGAVFDFPIDLNDKVLTWVRLFTTSRKGFIEGALSRATQYLPMVRQIFTEEGIPHDLAYLAVIESGYKNTANSRAQAVGMWQFIRSTGRVYGLTGNAWVEERRDPVKATRAAARYLRNLYESSGDWYLALTGYNAGPMTTERAIQGTGSRNYWDHVRSRFLRNETKNYVPELCAAILIGRFPERYGLQVPPLPPYAFETVEVDRMTSLSVLARFAGTDVQTLKDLNPELLRATTPPGRYTLRVPPGLGNETQRALAAIPSGQRLDFATYTLRKGDTPARVAARFSITAEDLLSTNNLRAAQFRPGRRIQVPPRSPLPISTKDLHSSAEKKTVPGQRPLESMPRLPETALPPPPPGDQPPIQPSAQPSVPVSSPVVTPPAEAPAPAPPSSPGPAARSASSRPIVHTVKKGETLHRIARKYRVTIPQIRAWNDLKRDRLTEGQTLRLRVR